jgi:hypothetical protein
MSRLLLTVVVAIVAGAVRVLAGRRRPAAPTQPRRWPVPAQLDRRDFARPDAPWLVVVFTSTVCDGCARVTAKAEVLAAHDVAYEAVSYQADKARHERYGVEAVPLVLVADGEGVVVSSFVGDVSATDLWAAVAAARSPLPGVEPCSPNEPAGGFTALP